MSTTTPSALGAASYISLATFRKDGRKVATPIWAAPLNDNPAHLLMFSDPNAGKVKRLRNSPRAEVAVCDVRGKLLGDWAPANAYLVHSPAEASAAARAIAAKYGWQSRLLDFTSWLGKRLHKRQYVRIELQQLN